MTLIIILIALGLDYFVGGLGRFREFNWFISLHYYLEKRLAHYKYWDGTAGLIVLLVLPLLGIFLLLEFAGHYAWIVEAVLTLIVLIYCLSPENLDSRLDEYITAINADDTDAQAKLEAQLINDDLLDEDDDNELAVIKSTFIESHKRTFAVLFWFLVLGAVGALLYRLVEHLHAELKEIRSGFADSNHLLLGVLEWPSTRLMVIGLALGGNLVEALPDWKKSEHFSFEVNDDVLIKSGLGALQYLPAIAVPDRDASYWIDEIKSLINRTLIIWLAILGIMTLSGKLG